MIMIRVLKLYNLLIITVIEFVNYNQLNNLLNITALRDVLWIFSTGWLSTNSNSIQIKPYSWFANRNFDQSPYGRLSLSELMLSHPVIKRGILA